MPRSKANKLATEIINPFDPALSLKSAIVSRVNMVATANIYIIPRRIVSKIAELYIPNVSAERNDIPVFNILNVIKAMKAVNISCR